MHYFINSVSCPAGKYENNGICIECGIGSYQDQTGMTSCIPCPPGKTTVYTGSYHSKYCYVDHNGKYVKIGLSFSKQANVLDNYSKDCAQKN